MENYINTSTIQHLIAILVYGLVAAYTIAKKKEIHRTTRRSTAEFILVTAVLAVLAVVNLIRCNSGMSIFWLRHNPILNRSGVMEQL